MFRIIKFKKSCKICNNKFSNNLELKENIYLKYYKSGKLCHSCIDKIEKFNKLKKCVQCGKPMADHSLSICESCEKNKFNYDIATAVYTYSDIFKISLTDYKFHGGFYLCKIFSELMVEQFNKMGINIDYIVFVPSKFSRIKGRGYNTSYELAHLVSKITHKKLLTSVLKKTKETPHQVNLSRKARLTNVVGSFGVSKFGKNKIANKSILLVDDVLTTGATASEIAKVLKKAGASEVYVLTMLTS